MLPPDKNQAYTPLSTISKKIGGYSINERWFHIGPGVYVTRIPNLPAIEESGWRLDQGVYTPLMNLAPPAPLAVIELIKCGCKTGCAN